MCFYSPERRASPLPSVTHSHSGSIPTCRSSAQSVCLVPMMPLAGCPQTHARVPRLHLPPSCPGALSHQLIWCVGSPAMWLDILEGFFDNSASCPHQYGAVLLQFRPNRIPEKPLLRCRGEGPGLPSLERPMHEGPGMSNYMLCSLHSLMWITIWLGTPATPIRTGMVHFPAAFRAR